MVHKRKNAVSIIGIILLIGIIYLLFIYSIKANLKM